MNYKVAVASSDFRVVNQHFGRAGEFLIFQHLQEGGFQFLEKRETKPLCSGGEHNEGQLERTVVLLADCRAVLVSQIGPGARAGLTARGITAEVLPLYIEDALQNLETKWD